MTRRTDLAAGFRAAEPGGGVATASAGGWFAAAELPSARRWFGPSESAVALADGTALVAGGALAGDTPTDEALVFDPVATTWTPTGALGTARHSHSVTPLADGRVLVAGGIGPTGPDTVGRLATAELYDPVTGGWTPTVNEMATARSLHAATVLADGRVLVTGGQGERAPRASGRSLYTAELFDPATDEWTTAAPMTDARCGHPAVLLQDGRVLAVGGLCGTGRTIGTGQGFCELYDPVADTWTPTGSLRVPRRDHRATLLADGTVLTTGGDGPGIRFERTFVPFAQWRTERYDPATGSWTVAENMPAGRTSHHAVPLPSGQVLVLGGTDSATRDTGYAAATLYDPLAHTWTPSGGMATGRYGCTATALPDGSVLATGGTVRSGRANPAAGEDLITATTEVFWI
ncbi:Kelch repeat-containing protein [Streptomyces sp. NPDC088387]|uniref:Kelch repeat-containing protein n=1 Tax=Streptomyces sp. NPDC088387 TaxID=3365859 RepID=UPI0037F52983